MAAVQLMAALHQRTLDCPDLADGINRGFPLRGMAHSLRTELNWLASEEDQTVIEKIADYMIERVVRRDRKSVVEGKRVSVGVVCSGCRTIKKNKISKNSDS